MTAKRTDDATTRGGVGRGALDGGKEATVLGTGVRLRRLAAMVGGENARDDSG